MYLENTPIATLILLYIADRTTSKVVAKGFVIISDITLESVFMSLNWSATYCPAVNYLKLSA